MGIPKNTPPLEWCQTLCDMLCANLMDVGGSARLATETEVQGKAANPTAVVSAAEPPREKSSRIREFRIVLQIVHEMMAAP